MGGGVLPLTAVERPAAMLRGLGSWLGLERAAEEKRLLPAEEGGGPAEEEEEQQQKKEREEEEEEDEAARSQERADSEALLSQAKGLGSECPPCRGRGWG